MNKNELEEELAKAEKQRKSYDTNRSLSALVVVFLIYNTYQGYKEGSTSWWFYALMVVFVVIAVVLVWFDSKRIKAVKEEIERLREEKESLERAQAEPDGIEDNEPDEGSGDSEESGDAGRNVPDDDDDRMPNTDLDENDE